jgi:L-iditol 2-dehydrogenase
MGHEASGVVAETGARVTSWKAGERVTFDSTIYCGTCRFCQRGEINLCDNRRVLGVSCDAYRQDGAFAEYVAVPAHILYRLPEDLSFARAAMVEAVSIAVHAVGRARIFLNDSALVVGVGTIGLLVVEALRLAGCGRIIAVDLDQERLDLACRLGADVGLRADAEDAASTVQSTCAGARQPDAGAGADLAFEVVGREETLHLALAGLRKGGFLTLIGNLSRSVALPLQEVVTKELSLHGSCASAGEYPTCLDLLARGKVRVDELISAVVPLAEGASWFGRLRRGEPGLRKVILVP